MMLWFASMSTVRRGVMITAACAVVFGSIAAVWLINNTKPIPAKYRQGISFPLYYPANLPSGYSVTKNSFSRKGSVLIFSIETPAGRSIAVSEEKVPPNVNLTPQLNQGGVSLPDEATFTTGIGSAQISLWGSNFVSSLVTPDTWVIINISGLTKQQGELITQSFQPL